MNKVQGNAPPQVLFVERCLSLLKPGGCLGLVLPESVLSNKSYRHVVEYLLKNADIRAVIGMPEALFKTSGKGGTHTKTCLLVAVKHGTRQSGKSKTVFMAEANGVGKTQEHGSFRIMISPDIADNFVSYRDVVGSTNNRPSAFLSRSRGY